MESSEFSGVQNTFPDAELLPVSGTTCDCYRVKLYGKLHFMKRLKPELRANPKYMSALQKEFETGYGLDHPHLVRYLSKGEDYFLAEYVDGLTLGRFVEENPVFFKSAKNANRFLSQLLDVVGYLHQHQIVHLDLKPSNILITRIGHDVKLTDLGYCYTDTYTDTMGRTDKYAAPEQLQGGEVDARTDIYAIGKILQTLPCASKYNKVIARCVQSVPSNRYQTVGEMKAQVAHNAFSKYIPMGVVLLAIIGLFLILQPAHQVDVVSQPVTDSVAASQVESVEKSKIKTEEAEKPLTRADAQAQLKAVIPPLVDSIYHQTIATYNFEKYGGNLDIWMPLHKEYVERINKLPKQLEDQYSLDVITISDIIWEYAKPPLDKLLTRMNRLREQSDSLR